MKNKSCYWDAIQLLEANSIEACIMRDELGTFDELDELDLMVSIANKKKAIELLKDLGWVIQDKGWFIPYKMTFYFYANKMLCKIDLHFELVDYGIIYLNANDFISTTTFINNLRVPSREFWLLHVILHTVLGKPKLAKKYHVRMNMILADPKMITAVNHLLERYQLKSVLPDFNIDSTNQYTDTDFIKAVKAKLRKHLLKTSPGNFLRATAQKVIWPVGQILGLRRGFTIAFIGPDGAGKSTTINALSKKLQQFSIPVRDVYMGPWEYPILPTTKLIRKWGASPRDEILGADKHLTKKIKGLVKRYVYYINVLLEVWARYLIKVLPRLLYRRVVLLDRFTYDMEVGFYNIILKNSKFLRKSICFLSPKPTITVLLINDPETIWARKKEYPLDVITASLEKYKEVGQRHQATTLYTGQPIETMIDEFIELHWKTMITYRAEGYWR